MKGCYKRKPSMKVSWVVILLWRTLFVQVLISAAANGVSNNQDLLRFFVKTKWHHFRTFQRQSLKLTLLTDFYCFTMKLMLIQGFDCKSFLPHWIPAACFLLYIIKIKQWIHEHMLQCSTFNIGIVLGSCKYMCSAHCACTVNIRSVSS